jgi:hypothetical protein
VEVATVLPAINHPAVLELEDQAGIFIALPRALATITVPGHGELASL